MYSYTIYKKSLNNKLIFNIIVLGTIDSWVLPYFTRKAVIWWKIETEQFLCRDLSYFFF